MNNLSKFAIVGIATAIVLSGCNSGTMPEGPSPSEIQKKIASFPPEKQIEMYKNSPMSPDQKAAKIAEIKAKYGLK